MRKPMTYEIEYEAGIKLDVPYRVIIERVIDQAMDQEECPYEAEISVTLTDNEGIREINREFRGIDSETDVLSFPMVQYPAPSDFDLLEDDSLACECFNPETGELLLGDIIISVEKVLEQAEKYGHSVTRELAFLVAHSMLHLFGYDHMEEDERIQMEERQRMMLDTLGITR